MRILVVEDDPILSHHLKVQLTELGNTIQLANTAKEGLYQAQHYPIDIAIIDLGLPDEDGISLIKNIRKTGIKRRFLF